MKKTIVVLVLFCVVFSLCAESSVTVDLSDMDDEDKLAFMFFYGYEAIMQKACKGAFLAIDSDMNYIGGWRTDQTPEDFCTNIPAGVIATTQVLPMGIAKTMFLLIGDNETVAKLIGMDCAGIYAVCMFLPYEGMELQAPAYNYGKRLLEDEAVRHGLNPKDFFSFMESQGITEESMVYTMYNNTATASEIVLDAMGMMEAQKPKGSLIESASGKLLIICGGCVGFLILLMLALIIYNRLVENKLKKADRRAEIEKHNKEVEQ